MKRVIALLTVLVLCFSLACPAFAADFVPSISEKDHPEVVPTPSGKPGVLVTEDGEEEELDEECIVITPVSEANTSTDIPEEAREALLEVYENLTNGTEELPYDKVDEDIDADDMVIRDLFDVSMLCDDHPEMLEKGAELELTFDLGVGKETNVVVMVYEDGEWAPAVKVINNGDGTVKVVLDRVGVLAVSVAADSDESPKTGDEANVLLWVVLMAASAAALAGVVIFRRKAMQ